MLYKSIIALLLLCLTCVAGNVFIGQKIFIGQQVPGQTYFQDTTTTIALNGLRNDVSVYVGLSCVAKSNCYITQLGRWKSVGNIQDHTLYVYFTPYLPPIDGQTNLSLCTLVAQATVHTSGAVSNQFQYVNLPTPLFIPAGQTFVLMSFENGGGDYWRDLRGYTVSNDFTNRQAGLMVSPFNAINTLLGTASGDYVPLDFVYTMPSTVFYDDFHRPDAPTLGPNYSVIDGTGPIIQNSNCLGTGAVVQMSAWAANTFNNDQYGEITPLVLNTTSMIIGLRTSGTNATLGGYICACDGTANPTGTYIGKFVNNALTVLTNLPIQVVPPTLVRFEARGSVLTVYTNGVRVLSCTDTTFTSGRVAIGTYGNPQLSNFAGGNL